MKKRKQVEREIPADLAAMSLEQLTELEKDFDLRYEKGGSEWSRLVAARDQAQTDLEAFGQRRRDITSAILAKLQERQAVTPKGSEK